MEHAANCILQGIAKFADLQETGADSQIQADTEDAGHCRNTSDKAVQSIVDISD
jgi:hypothetical protein